MKIGFRFEEIITNEERTIMYGIANNHKFDKKSVNKQLTKARFLK